MALIGPNEDPVVEAWAALAEQRARKTIGMVSRPAGPGEAPKTSSKNFDRN